MTSGVFDPTSDRYHGPDGIKLLWDDTRAEVEKAIAPTLWLEDEIDQAMKRWPDRADVIWHAGGICWPMAEFPETEFVYRGHFREVLDRVGQGKDTRPGTAAEVCMVCKGAALQAPLTHAGAGLYFRAWLDAFPANPAFEGHAEQVAADRKGYIDTEISGAYDRTRGKIGRMLRPARQLPKDLTCTGQHHGEWVACRFTETPALVPAPERAQAKTGAGRQKPTATWVGGSLTPERGRPAPSTPKPDTLF